MAWPRWSVVAVAEPPAAATTATLAPAIGRSVASRTVTRTVPGRAAAVWAAAGPAIRATIPRVSQNLDIPQLLTAGRSHCLPADHRWNDSARDASVSLTRYAAGSLRKRSCSSFRLVAPP